MIILLPDVNILLSLFDINHKDHPAAQRWFMSSGVLGWATCPLTENGFLRLSSNSGLDLLKYKPAQAIEALREFKRKYAATHHFWQDSVSLTDETLFLPNSIQGHKQFTDIYLLGLCQQNGGALATFDRRISTAAIVKPRPDLIAVLSQQAETAPSG